MKKEMLLKESIWKGSMENLFLDTNVFIDFMEKRDPDIREFLEGYPLFISVSSIGHWVYIFKRKVPNDAYERLLSTFNLITNNSFLVARAMGGPTSDYEDNLQLHSAVDAGCDSFLTSDKELLKMGYFGKLRIVESLD